MASTYSTNLRLELIGTGEQQGTWGATTNTNLGTLLEQAICGYESVPITDGADTTLTTANGTSDQARNMTLNLTGTLTAARNVICPAIEKIYIVKNATSGGFAVTFKVSGQTGVSIPNGSTVIVYVDGTDARLVSQFPVPVTLGGTGATTAAAAATNLGLGTTDSPQFAGVNVGNASDTTITRSAAGVIAVEGGVVPKENRANTFSANQIISVTDNTNAALRITQLGTGEAIRVEDETNPDSTPTVIDATGRVGVGTASPQKKLVVSNGGAVGLEIDPTGRSGETATSLLSYNRSGAAFVPAQYDASEHQFLTSTTTRVTIDSSGNVGIGGTALANLDVKSSTVVSRIESTTGTNTAQFRAVNTGGTFYFGLDASTGANFGAAYGGVLWHSGAYPILLATNNTERMRIDSSGNVGIGVSPGYKVHVSTPLTGTTVRSNCVARLQSEGSGRDVFLQFSDNVANSTEIGMVGGAQYFCTNSAERMRIDASGNVGIGTSSISTRLHVDSGAVDEVARLNSSGSTYLSWYRSNVREAYIQATAGAFAIWGEQAKPLVIATNNSERMRVDASGNVLVTSSGGLGYGTGSGGTVTQAPSKATGVTLNKTNGQIITSNSALTAGASTTFTVTNSTVAATDNIIITRVSPSNWARYSIGVTAVAAGSFDIGITNNSGASQSDAITLNFAIVKSVTS